MQQSWGKGQISLDNPTKDAWDQMHQDFDQNGMETSAGQNEVGRKAFENATQGQYDKLIHYTSTGDSTIIGYVPATDAVDNVKNINPDSLSQDVQNRLTNYAAGLINQIRAELNMPAVVVSSDAEKWATQITRGYDTDNWNMSDKMAHDLGRAFAPLNDKNNKLSYSSEIASENNFNSAAVSYNDLQKAVFNGIIGMLLDDQSSAEGHAIEITDANNRTNSAAIGLSFDKYGWMHIEFFQGSSDSPVYQNKHTVDAFSVDPSFSVQSADQLLNQTATDFDNLNNAKNQVAAQQETVDDAQKIVDQQQQIYDQDYAALQKINKRISDDTAKLNDLNNQLTAAQNKLADLQAGSQVTAAKQALADAQSKLNGANNALNSANQGVADAKANLDNANQAYQTAQAKLVEAQSKLASDTQAAKNAPAAVASAQKALQQAQSTLNTAQANLNKTALAYSNAQKQLQADQNKLTVAQEKLAKLTGQPMPVKPADKPAANTGDKGTTGSATNAQKPATSGTTSASGATSAEKPAANGSQSGSSSASTDKPAVKPAQSGSTSSASSVPTADNKQTPAQSSNTSANKAVSNYAKGSHTTANNTTSVKTVRHSVSSTRAKEETTSEKSSVVSIATSKHEFANISNENSSSKNSLPQTGEQSAKGSILAGIASILTGFGLLGVSKKKRN